MSKSLKKKIRKRNKYISNRYKKGGADNQSRAPFVPNAFAKAFVPKVMQNQNVSAAVPNAVQQNIKRNLYILVGPPGSGKSYWRKQHAESIVISRDDLVNKVATENGFIYDEMFIKPTVDEELGYKHPKYGRVVEGWKGTKTYEKVKFANQEVTRRFKEIETYASSNETDKDVIIDMTNMTKNGRSSTLKKYKDFKKIAIVFKPVDEYFNKKLYILTTKIRELQTGIKIPSDVINDMINRYEDISVDEKFDEVRYENNIAQLKQMILIFLKGNSGMELLNFILQEM